MEDAEVVEGGVNYAQGEDMFDQLMELAKKLLEKDAESVTDDRDLQILFKVYISTRKLCFCAVSRIL